ncbi:MAG: RsmD family RNA methyltransferase [Planctomycetota bacterium JB042]
MARRRRTHAPRAGEAPRILGGALKGRTLEVPKGRATRPLRALARRSLFDILGPAVRDARVLDLYAGAGTVGFEAVSRGAAEVVLVERAPAAIRALEKSVERLGVADRVVVEVRDVRRFLASGPAPFDVVFLGPPYPLWTGPGRAELEEVADELEPVLAEDGVLVLESPGLADLAVPGLIAADARSYGDTRLNFMRRPSPAG